MVESRERQGREECVKNNGKREKATQEGKADSKAML